MTPRSKLGGFLPFFLFLVCSAGCGSFFVSNAPVFIASLACSFLLLSSATLSFWFFILFLGVHPPFCVCSVHYFSLFASSACFFGEWCYVKNYFVCFVNAIDRLTDLFDFLCLVLALPLSLKNNNLSYFTSSFLVDNALKSIIGVRPVYMRPPYGNLNGAAQSYLNDKGYKIVKWRVDTNDWAHPDNVDASLAAYRRAGGSGFIALEHDTY